MSETRGQQGGRAGQEAPIGIFDSGFGGLTVARAVVDLLPNEDMLYLGDTARSPYGPKPLADVRQNALQCLDFLVEQGVKALVIACNSASSAVLRDARERYDVPVIDVILPAARRAVAVSASGRIGLICTDATARSHSYDDAMTVARGVQLVTSACPLFVDYVERGITVGAELERVAREYLRPLIEADVDTVVLGCTHYPLLAGMIGYILGDGVTLVSSAEACAREAYVMLMQRGLTHTEPRAAVRRFLTTGDAANFERIGRHLLSGFVTDVEGITIERVAP